MIVELHNRMEHILDVNMGLYLHLHFVVVTSTTNAIMDKYTQGWTKVVISTFKVGVLIGKSGIFKL